jgi:ribosomal protein L40E
MHVALGAILFLAVMAVTAVVFVMWVVVMLIQGLWNLLVGGPARPRPQLQARGVLDTVMCNHGRCHALNPAPARFCRRCGSPLQGQPAAATRRIAV